MSSHRQNKLYPFINKSQYMSRMYPLLKICHILQQLHYSKDDNGKYIGNTETLCIFNQSKYIGKGILIINSTIISVK